MKIRFNTIATIIKTAYKAWISKDPFRESAAIAYYSIFSLPGLLSGNFDDCRIFFWTRFG
jgi:membrane protein